MHYCIQEVHIMCGKASEVILSLKNFSKKSGFPADFLF